MLSGFHKQKSRKNFLFFWKSLFKTVLFIKKKYDSVALSHVHTHSQSGMIVNFSVVIVDMLFHLFNLTPSLLL